MKRFIELTLIHKNPLRPDRKIAIAIDSIVQVKDRPVIVKRVGTYDEYEISGSEVTDQFNEIISVAESYQEIMEKLNGTITEETIKTESTESVSNTGRIPEPPNPEPVKQIDSTPPPSKPLSKNGYPPSIRFYKHFGDTDCYKVCPYGKGCFKIAYEGAIARPSDVCKFTTEQESTPLSEDHPPF